MRNSHPHNLKRISLELGGKSANIIMDDADIDFAIEQAHFSLFFNAGQCCCAGSRAFVHEKIYDQFVERAASHASKLRLGGQFTGGGRFGDKGFYVEPTVFAGVTDDMTIAKEEIFGPVMSVMKFSDMDEVIARANNSNYGLAAGVVTKDLDNALTLAHSLRAGTIYVNCFDVFT